MNGNPFGSTGKAREKTSSGTSQSSGTTITVEKPPWEVVNFLLNAVDFGNGVAEFPVWASNATDFETLIEGVEDDEVVSILEEVAEYAETASLEDLFSVELEDEGIEFIGTEPLLNETERGEFSDLSDEIKERYNEDDKYVYGDEDNGLKAYIVKPDWLEVVREGRIDDTVINHVNYVINGYWYPEIQDFVDAEDVTRLKAQVGRNHNHQDEDGNTDEFSKRRHVAFSFEQTATTSDRIVSSAGPKNGVGTISEETVERYQEGEADLEDIAAEIEESRE